MKQKYKCNSTVTKHEIPLPNRYLIYAMLQSCKTCFFIPFVSKSQIFTFKKGKNMEFSKNIPSKQHA